jgi:membrane associated rhomboid family serine protease
MSLERCRKAPVTVVLLMVNAAFFATEEIFRMCFEESLFPILAMSRSGLSEGMWWQVLTHAFLHGNPLHLMVNMLALWFTGPLMEGMLGKARYLFLYLAGAAAGGLLQTFSTGESIDLVGASGAVCALLVGFGTLLPGLRITALLFFIIPLRMKASTLAILVLAFSFLFWILGIEQGIGHLAHLGGGIAGLMICLIYRRCGLVRYPMEELPPPLPD